MSIKSTSIILINITCVIGQLLRLPVQGENKLIATNKSLKQEMTASVHENIADINNFRPNQKVSSVVVRLEKENITPYNVKETLNDTSQVIEINDPVIKKDVIQSGALLRGIIVVAALSLLIVIYFAFRQYRTTKVNKTSTKIVCKYGVRTRRNDIEMLPLPLLEEDDDDSIFDIENHRNS